MKSTSSSSLANWAFTSCCSLWFTSCCSLWFLQMTASCPSWLHLLHLASGLLQHLNGDDLTCCNAYKEGNFCFCCYCVHQLLHFLVGSAWSCYLYFSSHLHTWLLKLILLLHLVSWLFFVLVLVKHLRALQEKFVIGPLCSLGLLYSNLSVIVTSSFSTILGIF